MNYLKTLLVIIMLSYISFATVVITTPYDYPAFKGTTVGTVRMNIGLYDSFNNITSSNSTHYTELWSINTGVATVNPVITSRTVQAALSRGTARDLRFYYLVSITNVTWCILNTDNKTLWKDVSNNTRCFTNYTKTYAETPFNSISLVPGVTNRYLLSFQTDSPRQIGASGSFNLTLSSVSLEGNMLLDPTISACGTISSSGSYTLTGNLNIVSNPTCLTIASSNVALDCLGYSISVSNNTAAEHYGIYASGYYTNVSIKNCLIYNTTIGIYLQLISNSSVSNTTIENFATVNGADGSSAASCSSGSQGSSSTGLYLLSTNSSTFVNLTIRNGAAGKGGTGGTASVGPNPCSGGTGGDAWAAYANFLVINCTFQQISASNLTPGEGGLGGAAPDFGGNGGAAGAGGGVDFVDTTSTGNVVSNLSVINIWNTKGGAGSRAVSINTKCTGGDTGGYGNTGSRGYGVLSLSTSNIFTDLYYYNITAGTGGAGAKGGLADGNGGNGGSAYGTYLGALNCSVSNVSSTIIKGGYGGNTTKLCNNAFGGIGGDGIHIYANGAFQLNNFSFTNTSYGTGGKNDPGTFNTPGRGYGVYTNSSNSNFSNGSISQISNHTVGLTSSARNNTFLNVTGTFTNSRFITCPSVCNFTRQWYARVNTTNILGQLNTSITVVDNFSKAVYSNSNANLTPWFIVNETSYGSSVNVYYNNQNVYASLSGYTSNLTLFNFSYDSATVNLTLYQILIIITATPSTQVISIYPTYIYETNITLSATAYVNITIYYSNFTYTVMNVSTTNVTNLLSPYNVTFYIYANTSESQNQTFEIWFNTTTPFVISNVSANVSTNYFTLCYGVICPGSYLYCDSIFTIGDLCNVSAGICNYSDGLCYSTLSCIFDWSCINVINISAEYSGNYWDIGDYILIWVHVPQTSMYNSVYIFSADNNSYPMTYLAINNSFYLYYQLKQSQEMIYAQSYTINGTQSGYGELLLTINPLVTTGSWYEYLISQSAFIILIIIVAVLGLGCLIILGPIAFGIVTRRTKRQGEERMKSSIQKFKGAKPK